MLRTKEFSIRSMLKKFKAEVICTTDDPADSLEFHEKLKGTFDILILPTFRPTMSSKLRILKNSKHILKNLAFR